MRIRLLYKTLPIVIALLGLSAAGAISFALYIHETRSVGDNKSEVVSTSTPSPVVQIAPSAIPSPTPSLSLHIKKKSAVPQSSLNPTSNTNTQATAIEQTSPPIAQTTEPTPSPVSQKLAVSLSIDGGEDFSVQIDQGRNQCDVLSQALQDGKISSLTMQYNSTYDSYAVYQINSLGQVGQVWWTYTVNGKSPPVGCSHLTVQSNDNVRWRYVGPR